MTDPEIVDRAGGESLTIMEQQAPWTRTFGLRCARLGREEGRREIKEKVREILEAPIQGKTRLRALRALVEEP